MPAARKTSSSAKTRKAESTGGLRSSIATVDKNLELKDGVLSTFRQWDTAGSGGISLPEMKAVLMAIGVPEADVPKIFSLADCNKDGIIDYEEFVSWLWTVAPTAIRRAQASESGTSDTVPSRRLRAAEVGGHPDMSPIGESCDARVVHATCKLAAPVCPHLDFTIKVSPSTRISELAQRICENHGGSIKDPTICVNRFHPEEVRDYKETLEDCGVVEGACIVYYDFVAQAGGVLA